MLNCIVQCWTMWTLFIIHAFMALICNVSTDSSIHTLFPKINHLYTHHNITNLDKLYIQIYCTKICYIQIRCTRTYHSTRLVCFEQKGALIRLADILQLFISVCQADVRAF